MMKNKYQFHIDNKQTAIPDPPDFGTVLNKALARQKWWQTSAGKTLLVSSGWFVFAVTMILGFQRANKQPQPYVPANNNAVAIVKPYTDSNQTVIEKNQYTVNNAATVTGEMLTFPRLANVPDSSADITVSDGTKNKSTLNLPLATESIKIKTRFRFKAIKHEEFLVEAQKGATIFTQSGSVITIPASAFGNVSPGQLVAVHFRQFRNALDLMVSGFSTFEKNDTAHQLLAAFEISFSLPGQFNKNHIITADKDVLVRLKLSSSHSNSTGYTYETGNNKWSSMAEDDLQPNNLSPAPAEYSPVSSPLLRMLGYRYYSKTKTPHWIGKNDLNTTSLSKTATDYQVFAVRQNGIFGSFVQSEQSTPSALLLQNPISNTEEKVHLWKIHLSGQCAQYLGSTWPAQVQTDNSAYFIAIPEYGDSAMICSFNKQKDLGIGWSKSSVVPRTTEELNQLRLSILKQQ